MKKLLCFDFDGVIHRYSDGWQDGSIYDLPMPGAKESLDKLSEKYDILIFSTRAVDKKVKGTWQASQISEMKAWWEKYNMPKNVRFYGDSPDDIGKPMFKLLVDDRALRFENWEQTVSDIEKLDCEGKL